MHSYGSYGLLKPHELLIPRQPRAPPGSLDLEPASCTVKVSGKMAPKKPGEKTPVFSRKWCCIMKFKSLKWEYMGIKQGYHMTLIYQVYGNLGIYHWN